MTLAVIGGSGLTRFDELRVMRQEMVKTPYGAPSSPVVHGQLAGQAVVFLARHGQGHTIPPHRINYRANLWALREMGATQVVAVAAVGGIAPTLNPGMVVIPDQLIDYTHGREMTFYDGDPVRHVDFTAPYDEALRLRLIKAAQGSQVPIHAEGCYGATQGPRLETGAEIRRMAQDGCTIVGMTGMPEAALARELELAYATCALVVNKAAGLNNGAPITMEAIDIALASGVESAKQVLKALLQDQSVQ